MSEVVEPEPTQAGSAGEKVDLVWKRVK